MPTTIYFKEEDKKRADYIKEQGDYSSRTEAVRGALAHMQEWMKKQQLKEKYSQEKSVPAEIEAASAEAFESLEDY